MRVFSLILFFLCAPLFANNTANPAAVWQLNDSNGKPVILVRLYRTNDGALTGKIMQFYPNRLARCTACPAPLTDRAISGLPIISGLQQDGTNRWSGGEILDPLTGETSKLIVTLSADGTKLKMTSYNLISWLGDNRIWHRRR